jgi:hypothetical protein
MTPTQIKSLTATLFFCVWSSWMNPQLFAQANVQVRINSGSSTTTCDDGFFGGAPDPHWRVEIAGQGYTTYPQAGICFTNTPNTQYNETFDCVLPTTLQICLRAFEDDGGVCIVDQQCSVTNCQNFAVPVTGSATYNISVGGASTANANFTITTTGSILNNGNDFICNALNLGTLPFGGSIGNESNFIYNNICATGGDPPAGSQAGVWFTFTTPAQVGTEITLEFESNGGLGGTFGDLLVDATVYEAPGGCSNAGAMIEVANSDDLIDLSNNETINFQCPQSNTTYYILLDGGSSPLDFLNLFDEEHGFFGIGIYDDGIVQAADYICDAEDLGTPSPGSPVSTLATLQSNICATQFMASGTNEPLPGTNWSTDPNDQQGVWFQFTAPASGSVVIEIESTGDILNIFQPNDLSVQVALYGTSNNICSGTLDFIDEQESDLTPCGYLSVPINNLHDEIFKVACLEPGDPYWILVDGDPAITLLGDGVEGYFEITVSDWGFPPAPNDDICNATFLGAPMPGSPITLTDQSNHCASNFVEVNNFGWSNESGVWYSFIAPPSGAVEIWAENQFLYTCVPAIIPIPVYEDALQVELAVFGSASGLTCTGNPVADQNDENVELVAAENEIINDIIDGGINILDAANDEYMFVECLIPGETYYIMVDGYPFIEVLGITVFNTDLLQGIFDIRIEAVDQTAPTSNDLPCQAIALGDPTGGSVGGGTTYNNYCATVTGEPDVLAFDTTQTVWFEFIAPSTGSVNVDVNENGDDINLQIAVFVSSTGDCTGTLNEIASNDNELGWDVEIDEIHCLTPGETYFLMVDGEPEFTGLLEWEEGEFTVQINEIPTLPNLSLNNLICDANAFGNVFTSIGTSLTINNENNLCANNLNDPEPSCFDTDYTVWYEFTTPPGAGTYAVEVFVESDYWTISNPFDFSFDAIDPQLAVYAADPNDCTGALTEIGCSYTFDINIFDAPEEELLVECLEPNTTYYIMVDGATTFVGDIGFGQGNFDISLTSVATNPSATNNDICDNINLGTVPTGGAIPPNTDYYNFCADTELGEPSPFGLDQTVWFTFTAPNTAGANASSSVTINLESDPNNLGDEINLQLAVYEAANCSSSLTLLDSEFDGILYAEDLELTCLTPGQEYYLQIDGGNLLLPIGGIEGYFTIEIVDDGGGMFPTNDDICATAYPLGTVPDGGSINPGLTFSNLCATIQAGEPDPGFGLGADDIDQTVWFTFSPSNSGNVLIDANSDGGDNIDLQLAVYYSSNGTCDPTTMVPINYEWQGFGAPFTWDEDLTVTCLDPNVTYYLQVDGSSVTEDLQSGNFTLEINDDGGSTIVPYNNDICDAFDFMVVGNSAGEFSQTNVCADIEPGEPGIFGFAQNTVWYQFTASASGRVEIIVDPASILNLFPEVHLYSSSTGDCTGTLTEIASDDIPNFSGDVVIETSCIIPGETYFIQVDGQLVAPQGLFDIILINPEPVYGTGVPGDVEPANNECIDATPVTVQSESCFIGDGIFQTVNYGEPTISLNDAFVQGCNGNGNCGDTWYCFNMPPSGAVLIEGNDENGIFANDLTMIAYVGDCNGLTPLNCESNDEVTFEVAAAAGTKIYLQIFDGGLDYPNEDYQICVSEQCGADDCLNAILMEPNVPYCWDTSSALGEDLTIGVPGYAECATSTGGNPSPEHSVFFSFTSDCNGGSITLSIFDVTYDENNPNYQPCDGLFGTSSDGFTVSIFADATPCDNNFDDLLWCNVVDGCAEAVGLDSYEQTFDNLNANTEYIIMLDGGVTSLFGSETGGNVEGQIMITTLTNPDIDSMVVVDSIACFGELGTVTAEVSGGTYPYIYNWDNVGADSIYTNVSPGWHYVTVTANNGCEETDSIFLPEPPLLEIAVLFDPTTICYGEPVVANVSAIGGTPNYDYLWSNGETIADPILLEFGNTYTVTITDDAGCTMTEEIVVPLIELGFIRD